MARQTFSRIALAAAGLALLTAASQGRAEVLTSDADLQPGLSPCYINGMIRHVDEILEWEKHRDCKPGPVLTQLDSRAGEGKVLTSPWSDGVMAKITGYIHLAESGTYGFVFQSNDGVRLLIDGARVVEDPGVHADQFSEVGQFQVPEPGWYPITIYYFERKNTSTLRFFWQPPGTDGTMPVVPAAALAHKAA